MTIYFSKRAYFRAFGVEYDDTKQARVTRSTIGGSASVAIPLIAGSVTSERVITTQRDQGGSHRAQVESALGRHKKRLVPLSTASQGDLVKCSSSRSIIGGLPVLAVNYRQLEYAEKAVAYIQSVLRGRETRTEVPKFYWMVGGEMRDVIDRAESRLGWERKKPYDVPVFLFGSLDNYVHFMTYCPEITDPVREWIDRYPGSFPSNPERLADVMGEIFDLDPSDVATEAADSMRTMTEQAAEVMDRTFGRMESGRRVYNPVGVNRESITVWGMVSDRDQFGAIVRPILIEHE